MVFLELRRDSRVTTGNSGCLLCWPRQVQSSIRVAKESWGLLSSDCRAKRPHLGLCPEANVPLHGRQGSRGCIPDAPGETGIHLEWKQRTPLCSRVATGISWSSLGGLKGVKPPEAFGERSRGWPLGHAGDECPHLRDDGGVSPSTHTHTHTHSACLPVACHIITTLALSSLIGFSEIDYKFF